MLIIRRTRLIAAIITIIFAALVAAGCTNAAVTAAPPTTTVATAPATTTTQAPATTTPATTTPATTNLAGTPIIPTRTYTAAQDEHFLAELAGYGLDYPAGAHRDGILLIGHGLADILNDPNTTTTPTDLMNGLARGLQDQNPPLPKYVIGEIIKAVVDAYTTR